MNATRPPALSPEDVEKIVSAMSRKGASISMTDARFTAVQTWFIAAMGVSIIGLQTWLINTVNELNITMTRVVTQNEARDQESARIQSHLEYVDKRVVDLERSDLERRGRR